MNASAEKQTVCVYIGAVCDFAESADLPGYAALAAQKAKNRRVGDEKRAGYGLLAFALKHMGINASVRECFLSETGKPLHEGFEFSISHSEGLAAVAVSPCGRVGVDVEAAEKLGRTERLKAKIVCEGEENMNPLVLWTLKEAAFKCRSAESGFMPKTVKTADYKHESIKFAFSGREFILSVTMETPFSAVFYNASNEEELTFELLK